MSLVTVKKQVTAAVVSPSAQATRALGFSFAKQLQEDRVLLLRGDLGSGKTCFVQGLARGLDIKANVHSPTYTLINEYPLPRGGVLYHLDCYRTDQADTLLAESIAELLTDPQNLLVVEWGERLPTSPVSLAGSSWRIAFTYLDEDRRRLYYTAPVAQLDRAVGF